AYQLIRLNLANFYYKNGYYSLAEEEYLKLISSDYKNGDIFAKLGNIYFKKGNKKEALLYWEESLKFNPDDLTVLKNIKIVIQDYGLGI
ncbi:tetratricopeptide repeat protein, partial [candidate division WOR-3 bacterium]|nr:tetratricopeptide repeat protein [candidate division WOR-3 bacterium]